MMFAGLKRGLLAGLSLVACTPGATRGAQIAPADAPDAGATKADAVSDLVGARPAAPLSAPEFSALDQDGEHRDRSFLLGHPTVLWFYVMAGTPG
jgi:hypothetical protein